MRFQLILMQSFKSVSLQGAPRTVVVARRPSSVARRMARALHALGVVVKTLVLRANRIGILLYLVGLSTVLTYPKLARRIYVDENAFLLGSTGKTFDAADAHAASGYANALEGVWSERSTSETTVKRLEWITSALDARGFESYYASTAFNAANESSDENRGGEKKMRMNVHAIARAARGDGRESIALVTPLGKLDPRAEAATVGIALRVFEVVGRAPWLAKDLIWVCVDAEAGEIESTMDWLKTYHSFEGKSVDGGFERAGTIQQAFVFSAPHGAEASMMRVKVEGWNGAYPNQDIYTMFKRVTESTSRLKVSFDENVGEGLDGSFAGSLKSVWRFMWRAITGVPTGAHAAFKAHSIDAISIEARSSDDKRLRTYRGTDAYAALGQTLELSLRSCNNLLELLHHSCFYYIMLGSDKFLGIAEYIAPQVVLLVSLVLPVARLTTFGPGDFSESGAAGEKRTSHNWFRAVSEFTIALALSASLGGICVRLSEAGLSRRVVTSVVLAMCPVFGFVFCRIAKRRASTTTSPKRMMSKIDGVTILSQEDWVAVKVINMAWVIATMSACTFFNFALALLTTAALAPLCLLYAPAQSETSRRASTATLCALPILWIFVVSQFADSSSMDAFGLLAEHHSRWRTFALPVVFGIIAPTLLCSARVVSSAPAGRNKQKST